MNWEAFNRILTTRFKTDYAAGGGTFPVTYDGSPTNNTATSWVRFSWVAGSPTAAVSIRRESHPIILFASIFGPPSQGRKALFTQAGIIANLWRAQRYIIDATGAGAGLSLLPLDGANQIDTTARATLKFRSPSVTPVPTSEKHPEQVNVSVDAELEIVFQNP